MADRATSDVGGRFVNADEYNQQVTDEMTMIATPVLIELVRRIAGDGEIGVYRQAVLREAANRLDVDVWRTPRLNDAVRRQRLGVVATVVDVQDVEDEREMSDEQHERNTTTRYDGQEDR